MRHLQVIRKSIVFGDRVYDITYDKDQQLWTATLAPPASGPTYFDNSLSALLHRLGIIIEVNEGWRPPRLIKAG